MIDEMSSEIEQGENAGRDSIWSSFFVVEICVLNSFLLLYY